jgi:signal transduction histidine kinase
MGMTELCLMADPSERQRHCLTSTGAAAAALLHIIDDILDYSKVEAGKLAMAQEPFTLAGVFERLTALLAGKAQEKGLQLLIQVAPDLAARVLLGDPLRLGQVLINLTGNAIKFSQRGQ